MQLTIVLVCIGQFQDYILCNIRNLLHLNNSSIVVITSSEWFSKFAEFTDKKIELVAVEGLHDSYGYMSKSTQDKRFRGGFWALASERFFYLYAYMKSSETENVIHLENDVHIYYDVQVLAKYLDVDAFRTKIVMPFDAYTRNIASIMYVPTADVFRQVLDKYNMNLNDMQNFVEIRRTTGLIDSFPICVEGTYGFSAECSYVTQNFDKFGGFVFDAAAMGQYLGGVDPRNQAGDTRGFVNETCVIKYDQYKFVWTHGKPYLQVGEEEGNKIPIFNLHIHSKNLDAFSVAKMSAVAAAAEPVVTELATEHVQTQPTDKKKKKKKNPHDFPNYDIVIPLGPNEVNNIDKQISRIKQFVVGYRNIYIVTNTATITSRFTQNPEGCTVIDESTFPFHMNDIAAHFAKHGGKNNRNGWYLQQLIKLYAGFVIPNILENYLVIDADVFFLRPVEFFNRITEIDAQGKREFVQYCFCTGVERFPAYFDHMKTLHSSLKRVISTQSGICHHMMFCKQYVKELFDLVKDTHGDKPFWRVFIESVKEHLRHDPAYSESGASEYEIYFNFMLMKHPEKVFMRRLKWLNVSCKTADNESSMDTTYSGYDFVSVCWYKM